MNRIDGKIAVVTGGTQGLGAAVASELAQVGAKGIVTCGRSIEKGEGVARRIAGSIVNIGSTSAHAGQPFISAYCASKGALATLTRNTAFALMRNRIRVNQLNIGWMASDGEDRIQREYHGAPDDWLEKAAAAQPWGRLVAPAEVARAVAFLASADSGLMTGAVIHFDQSVWAAYDGAPPVPAEAMTI